jgi:hypothetical protein
MKALQHHNNYSIQQKMDGWGQPAYNTNFCEGDFKYKSKYPEKTKWHWHGTLQKFNMSVSLFMAAAPEQNIWPRDKPRVPCYHAKACHGGASSHKDDPAWRVTCKEDMLKDSNQWFLPGKMPTTLAEWHGMSDELVKELQALLFQGENKPLVF